jgi:hypothetical protein
MVPDALHVIDPGVGDLRVVEPVDHSIEIGRGERFNDQFTQRGAVLEPLEIGAEALIFNQLDLSQDFLAKHLPFLLILHTQHHQ